MKNMREIRRMGFREVRCEREIQMGTKTVLVRRKDVPVQKAWRAVPERAVAIVFEKEVSELV